MTDTISTRVRTLIADEIAVGMELVTDEALLGDDLGADSLDAIQLSMALEEEFDIDIPDQDAEQLVRVGDVIAYVERSVQKNLADTAQS